MPGNSPNGCSTKIVIQARDLLGLASNQLANRGDPVMQLLINYLTGGLGGAPLIDSFIIEPDTTGDSVAGFAVVSFSSGSGTVGFIVNGRSVTETWATSDQASMTAWVTAFNADTDAAIANIVYAGGARKGNAACASVAAGDTFTLAGVTLTAVAGTAQFRQFSKDTSDTATALSLAGAINADPVLGYFYAAYGSSADCVIYPKYTGTTAPTQLANEVMSAASTITLTQLTADPSCCIYARVPGAGSNANTIEKTGTGATLVKTVTPGTALTTTTKLFYAGAGANSSGAYFGRLP